MPTSAAADVVFCCLPHAASMAPVAAARGRPARAWWTSAPISGCTIPKPTSPGITTPTTRPALLAEAVYGLPELHRAAISRTRLVANPGCYPTSIILGLAPLAAAGWLSGTIVADSKSGVSGAGRQPSQKTHFVEANENLSPYSIGRSHRHLAEMEQELAEVGASGGGGSGWSLIFSPHLLPVNRGILSTVYVNLPQGISEAEVRERYAALYAGEPFVQLLTAGPGGDAGAHRLHQLLRHRPDVRAGHHAR